MTSTITKIFFIAAVLFLSITTNAQYYNCNTAIRICDALENDFSMSLDQVGTIDLPTGNDGCLSGETNGSGWFYLETTGTGLLGFDLIASDAANVFTDVDFAVYGPFTTTQLDNGSLCAAINGGTANPIRCSYADDANYCFSLTNNTGLDSGVANNVGCNNNTTEFSETAAGNGFVSSISATPGQVYMVYVDDFSGTTENFTLTFTLLTHPMVATECGQSPCTCTNGGSCPGNHYADEPAADAAYTGIVNEDDAPCFDLTPEGISTADGSFQFCYEYTTGATEEYMGAAITAFLDAACINSGGITSNLVRLYPIVAATCGAPVASAGTTPLGYSYYDVTPNTTYKLCQELTINPLAVGCDGGRFGSVCPVLFAYEPCFLTLGTETRTCNPEGTEYTLTVPFTGGGTRPYTITGATNTGANPSSVASGNMTFGPFAQGTSYNINIAGGTCDIDIVGSYTCIPPCDFAPETIADFSVTCGNTATLNIGTPPALYGFGDVGEFAGPCTEISNAGHTAVTLADDAVSADLNVGFSFNFFGNTYTQFRIHSNGFISFGGQTYTGFANFAIPNATDPDNFIAGLYGDLNPTCGGSITYATTGAMPNRQLIVTFSDIEPYQSGCAAPATEAVSFQIVLNEDGAFYVAIIDYPPSYGASTAIASNVTSGYENADGTIADAATGYNGQSGAWVDESAGASPVCWGAYPLTNPCVFDRWEDGSGNTVGTTASLVVTPSATTTYTAVWNCAGTECTDPLTVTVTGTPPTATGATICAGGSGTLTSSSCVATTGSTTVCAAIGGAFGASPGINYNLNFSAIPTGATVTSISYESSAGSTTDWRSEIDFNISSPTLPDGVDINFGNCCAGPNSAGPFTFPAGTSNAFNGLVGQGTWNVEWHDEASPFNGTLTADVAFCLTVNWTTPASTLQWYTVATGGTAVQTGTPFNPVGDAEVIAAGAPYSSLTNTNTPGTYTFYAACSSAPNCRTATNFVISTAPSVTASNDGPLTCTKTTVALSPSAASGTVTYAWPGGLTSVSSAGTYTVTATDSANGCTATSSTIVAANNTAPTFTGVASCSGGLNTGSVSQAATGGSGTYTYTISGGSFGPTLSNGTYTITVSDTPTGCTATGTVTVSCAATCPDLTAQAPAAVVSSQSTCTACVLGGGVIAAPATTCPVGSTLQYSTDGGTVWSATLPTYNQTTAMTVLTRCNCNTDNTQSSPTNTVTTIPGICTPPAATAGSNSPVTCGGTINLTSSGGGTYAWTGPSGYTSTSQNPSRSTATATMGGTYTVVVTGANGCTASASTTVTVNACGFAFGILDPCACRNNATTLINGQFNETVIVTGPAGFVVRAEIVTGLYQSASTAVTLVPFTIPVNMPYNGTNGYQMQGVHVDNTGYTVTAGIYEADGVTPVDLNGGAFVVGDNLLSIGNKCAYPNPDFSIGSFVDCNTAMALTTVHSAEGNGTAAYSGTGVSGTNFTPTGLTGAQTIALTYTGINDGNSGISPDSGTTPAFPGCQEVIQKSVTVNCPACQASPNMQWGNN